MEYVEPHWYAAHTCARHEKRVAEHLARKSVEFFLPLHGVVHRWKDRRKQLLLPLFPGYVFVRIALQERSRVLELPGVVRLVGFGFRPMPLPDLEIVGLQHALAERSRVEPHPYLIVGRRVLIMNGPLRGLRGILLRKKGAFRVVISIDLIMRSVALEIDIADVKPILGAVPTIDPKPPRLLASTAAVEPAQNETMQS